MDRLGVLAIQPNDTISELGVASKHRAGRGVRLPHDPRPGHRVPLRHEHRHPRSRVVAGMAPPSASSGMPVVMNQCRDYG